MTISGTTSGINDNAGGTLELVVFSGELVVPAPAKDKEYMEEAERSYMLHMLNIHMLHF